MGQIGRLSVLDNCLFVCLFVYWFDSVILNLYLRTFQYKTASFGLVEVNILTLKFLQWRLK